MSAFCPTVFRDAAALTGVYARGALTPPATLKVRLGRIERTPHVMTRVTEARAQAEAQASLERWRVGRLLGPLDGVPIVWKDLFDVQGTPTSAGAVYWMGVPAACEDAPVVARATAQGLVCVGKTNLSELAFNVTGVNSRLGTPHNAFLAGPPRLPGGSSSGAAIAVAAGIAPLAVGTDTAGSIRVPAAYNGLCGYKATSSRHPALGMFPLAPPLDSLGIIARTVADIQALDAVLAGVPAVAALESVEGLRLLLDASLLEDVRVEPAVRARILASAALLERAGARVERGPCRFFQAVRRATEDMGWLGAFEAGRRYGYLLDGPEAEHMDPMIRTRLDLARRMPDDSGAWLHTLRNRLLNEVEQELDGALLLSPTVPHAAPLLEDALCCPEASLRINGASHIFTSPCNFLDMPSLALPCGVDSGHLPLSLQLSAPRGQDARLLAEGAAVSMVLRPRE